ncbi:hypothetical protein GCM10023081_05140 [Arthrobacter ginkgonis]|uniref:Uncharacterized protein n=1 Tax=Arthrobacter ginkgonis TaxID=1630594 RepID=A0ABP7BTT5_9MICC
MDLPTTTGFITVGAEITAKTAHLVHVLHADESGRTLCIWLPPQLVRPCGADRRGRAVPPTDGGGGGRGP